MPLQELADALRLAVDNAADGEIVVSIHLTRIGHDRELRDVPLRELVDAARIHRSYATEIRKGMKLAEYVRPK